MYVDHNGFSTEAISSWGLRIAGILALIDGPLPFGDVAAVVVLTVTAVALVSYVTYTNWDEIKAISKEAIETINSNLPRDYSVYFLQEDGNIQYVGRVKTQNFNQRMKYHQKTKGLTLAYRIDNLSYLECRGAEQVGIAYFQTLGKSNKINGVGRTNKKAPIYKAAWDYINNQVENEWLNLIDLFN